MMERDPVEEHRRQQEDEDFWRARDEELAATRGSAPDAERAAPKAPKKDGSLSARVFAYTSRLNAAKAAGQSSPAGAHGLEPSGIPMPKGMGVAVAVVVVSVALGWMGLRYLMPGKSDGAAAGSLPLPGLVSDSTSLQPEPGFPATLAQAADLALPDALAELKALLAEEKSARELGDASLAEQLAALNARLDVMERRMSDVVGGLKAKGYLNPEADPVGALRPEDFVAHPGSVKKATAPRGDRTASTQAKASASRGSTRPARTPALDGQQLLSIDLWNGRPSVVVSNGNSAAPEVKVLEPGDAINGVTLRSVNMASGLATFVNAQNQIVTLQVAGQP